MNKEQLRQESGVVMLIVGFVLAGLVVAFGALALDVWRGKLSATLVQDLVDRACTAANRGMPFTAQALAAAVNELPAGMTLMNGVAVIDEFHFITPMITTEWGNPATTWEEGAGWPKNCDYFSPAFNALGNRCKITGRVDVPAVTANYPNSLWTVADHNQFIACEARASVSMSFLYGGSGGTKQVYAKSVMHLHSNPIPSNLFSVRPNVLAIAPQMITDSTDARFRWPVTKATYDPAVKSNLLHQAPATTTNLDNFFPAGLNPFAGHQLLAPAASSIPDDTQLKAASNNPLLAVRNIIALYFANRFMRMGIQRIIWHFALLSSQNEVVAGFPAPPLNPPILVKRSWQMGLPFSSFDGFSRTFFLPYVNRIADTGDYYCAFDGADPACTDLDYHRVSQLRKNYHLNNRHPGLPNRIDIMTDSTTSNALAPPPAAAFEPRGNLSLGQLSYEHRHIVGAGGTAVAPAWPNVLNTWEQQNALSPQTGYNTNHGLNITELIGLLGSVQRCPSPDLVAGGSCLKEARESVASNVASRPPGELPDILGFLEYLRGTPTSPAWSPVGPLRYRNDLSGDLITTPQSVSNFDIATGDTRIPLNVVLILTTRIDPGQMTAIVTAIDNLNPGTILTVIFIPTNEHDRKDLVMDQMRNAFDPGGSSPHKVFRFMPTTLEPACPQNMTPAQGATCFQNWAVNKALDAQQALLFAQAVFEERIARPGLAF